MATYKIPFGSDNIEFNIDDKNFLYYASPVVTDSIPDQENIITHAFENPHNSKKLEQMVNPSMKIIVIIDDITRPTPKRLLLDHVLSRLTAASVPDKNITIAVALGTHRQITGEEITEHIGNDIIKKYRFLNIDYKDAGRFINLGTTENGTPIEVYREVVESDFKIAIGNIVPHPAAGWGGGGKMIQPGVCSEKTTEVTHLMACTIQNVLEACGTVDNPCRQEIEKIAGQVGLDFIINTVMDEQKNILGVFCGHYIDAHRAGVKLATEVLRPLIPQRADIVIASANPADIDFWQGCKPYIYSHFGVRDGGVIILVIHASEGLCGNAPQHEATMRKYTTLSFEAINLDIKSGAVTDIVGANVPLFCAVVRDRAQTICVSEGMNDEDIKCLGFIPAANIKQALEKAFEIVGYDAKIGIIPFCGETLVRDS